MTSSSDNSIKIWNISGELHKTLRAAEGEEKIENQLIALGITKEFFYSFNLNSDLLTFFGKDIFEEDKLLPQSVSVGHKNHVTALANRGDLLVSGDQDGRLFYWQNDLAGEFKAPTDWKLSKVEKLVFNADGTQVITSHVDNSVRRWRLEGFQGVSQLALEGVAIGLAAHSSDPEIVFVVLHTADKLLTLKGDQIEHTQAFDSFEAETVGHSKATNELIVGDKKGVIHFLDAAEPGVEKGKIEKKHNHAISALTVSEDGTKLATGDTYRYIYIFDLAERKEIGCQAYHLSKVNALTFNPQGTTLATVGNDLTLGTIDIAAKQKKVKKEATEKETKDLVFTSDSALALGGIDCAIRHFQA